MKNLLLLLPLAIFVQPACAQQTELSARVGLVLSNFLGPGSVATSTAKGDFFDAATPPPLHITPYLRNPYSQTLGAGISASLRVQRVGQGGGLAALELGVDQAQSHSRVTWFDGTPPLWMGPHQLTEGATGSARLRRWVIPIFAGIGYRFQSSGPLQVDVLVGPELALIVGASEKGSGTHRGIYQPVETPWQIDLSRSVSRHEELRLRADLTAWHHRLGLNANYSWSMTDTQAGLTDFPDSYVSGSVHSQTLRLGVVYRLR